MKAARLYAPGDIRVDEIPEPPPPGPCEVLLAVTAVGICGSDLHYYREGGLGGLVPEAPLILGHEFAARVEAVGPGVALPVGTRVAVEPGRPCGRCESCLEGNPNLCPAIQFCGSAPVDGALRERMLYPENLLFPLPDNMTDAEGAALEPLGIALHALRLVRLQPGQTAAVLGGGPIGLMLAQLCRGAGAVEVIVTEPVPHRREAALKSGATAALDPSDGPVGEAIRAMTGGRGVDVAFEAAGAVETPAEAVQAVRPGGHVVLVGIPADDRVVLSHAVARRKGLTIRFARRMKHTYPRAIALVASGALNLRPLLTHHFPLVAAAEAFRVADAYADGALKVTVRCDDGTTGAAQRLR
jgi:L-iditol 2-dehydrogenase